MLEIIPTTQTPSSQFLPDHHCGRGFWLKLKRNNLERGIQCQGGETVKVTSFPNFDKKVRLKTTSRSSLGMEKGETKKTFQGGRVMPERGELETRTGGENQNLKRGNRRRKSVCWRRENY